MTRDLADLLDAQKAFEGILHANGNLVWLETSNVEEMLIHFRQLALRGGQAVYLWEPQGGIAPLRATELHVPASIRLADALRYVLQSVHFGVYLFTGFESELKAPIVSLLQRISRTQTGHGRKLVFLPKDVTLPTNLSGLFECLNLRRNIFSPPRLRDGRWVV